MHVSSFSIIKKKKSHLSYVRKISWKIHVKCFLCDNCTKIIQRLFSVMNRIIIYFTKSFHFTKQQNNQNS